MADCKDTITFLREWGRMCAHFKYKCEDCDMSCICGDYEALPEQARGFSPYIFNAYEHNIDLAKERVQAFSDDFSEVL